MAPRKSELRYAHSDGHTDLCFDDSGRYMLTCGTDGDVRIWQGIDDDDAISHRAGDKLYAIAYQDGKFFTASDMNNIQAFSFPDGSPDGIIARFTAPVTHMGFSKSGNILVAGACDFSVKIIEVTTSAFKTLHGHQAPILSIAMDPKEEFVATSCCDGTVRVWKLASQEQVHSWTLLKKCADVSLSQTLCRLCWEPTEGKNLFIPVGQEVHVYKRDSWEKDFTLSHSTIQQSVSIIAFSPCGAYVAAAATDGVIVVWKSKTWKTVTSIQHEKKLTITALAWNPSNKQQLAYCDHEGQLGVVDDLLSETPDQAKTKVTDEEAANLEGLFDDDDDDDMLVAASGMEGDGDAKPVDSDDDDVLRLPSQRGPKLESDDAQDDTDAQSTMSTDDQPPPIPVPAYVAPPPVTTTPLQKPFQPGSTPEHLTSRFMKWNSVGIIRQYTSDEESSIDVEFHDTSIHHAMHLSNEVGYKMADLSTEAAVFAAEAESDTPSKLLCMHFGSWDSAKEWSTQMPDHEEITAVAISDGWIAVATDRRNIRLFSLGGVQREVFSVPGPVVCLVGWASRLMIVYHKGQGIPGDQSLGVYFLPVLGTNRRMLLDGTSLAITPKSTLAWAGFSAEGTPITVDSSGIVRMLNRSMGNMWSPIANTKQHTKGKSDNYWIVGINESPQQLRCIPCKGSHYPPTLPRPAVTILPFQLSMCELGTEKSDCEETLWRTHMFAQHADTLERHDLLRPAEEALIKLFALSTRVDREFRAVELCRLMTEQQTLELAIKYASRLGHLQLAGRVSDIVQRRATQEDEEQEEDVDMDEPEASGYTQAEYSATAEQDDEVMEGNMADIQEDEDEEDVKPALGPMLNLSGSNSTSQAKQSSFSSLRSNPFKIGTPSKTVTPVKGSRIFDSISKQTKQNKPVTVLGSGGDNKMRNQQVIGIPQIKKRLPKKIASQTPVNTAVQNGKQKLPTAYELWLESMDGELRAESPGLAEAEFTALATQRFKDLPREDKQSWLLKAREMQNADPAEKSGQKRKEPDETGDGNDTVPDDDVSDKAKKIKCAPITNSTTTPKTLSSKTNAKLSNFLFSTK